MRIKDKEGKAFVLYTDAKRLEQHMKELAPEDADTIDRPCYRIRHAPGQFINDKIRGYYEYWKELEPDRKRYRAEKEQFTETVIAQLDRRYPGLAEQVEMVDVATPTIFGRYTGNWKGNHRGWLPSTESFGLRMEKTLPRLKDFYMAGQRVQPPGGLPIRFPELRKEDQHARRR